MGITPNEAGVYHVSKHKGYDLENLNYHTSWDWLMPVVEKIEFESNPEVRFNVMQDDCIVSKKNNEGYWKPFLTKQ